MSRRLLIFHPALAPYRVDFFNLLSQAFSTELVLFDTNLVNQKFDQQKLVGRMNCKVSYLTNGFRWKDRYFRTGALRKIWRYKPDIVLGCEYSPVTVCIALWKLVFRSRFKLFTITDDNIGQFNARRGIKKLLRWFFVRALDGIIVTNAETANAYKQITPAQAKIVYPIVPILHASSSLLANRERVLSEAKAWREAYLKAWRKVLVFVGRLDPEKNVGWLIDRMGDVGKDIGLVLIGSGTEEDALKNSVAAAHVENVRFLGRKEGDDVYRMMAMADVLVLPSVFEPYGAVVGEALLWGTPCLVSDHVGASVLIHEGENGAVFKTGDAADFQAKLSSLLHCEKKGKPLLEIDLETAVEKLVSVMQGRGSEA